LGRTSYAVAEWCNWFIVNHKDIPGGELAIIKKELREAFEGY